MQRVPATEGLLPTPSPWLRLAVGSGSGFSSSSSAASGLPVGEWWPRLRGDPPVGNVVLRRTCGCCRIPHLLAVAGFPHTETACSHWLPLTVPKLLAVTGFPIPVLMWIVRPKGLLHFLAMTDRFEYPAAQEKEFSLVFEHGETVKYLLVGPCPS